MNVSYLTTDDKKHIAHFLAERSISHISGLETQRTLEKYIETYNAVLETIEKKND